MNTEIMNLPNIVMPGETSIRKAVSRLNNKFPGFFKNVKEIRVAVGGTGYGYVTNDPKSQGVIFLDFNKIKSNITNMAANQPLEATNEALISAIEEVLSHEVGHLDAKLEGGEYPAEQKARESLKALNAACDVFNRLTKINHLR